MREQIGSQHSDIYSNIGSDDQASSFQPLQEKMLNAEHDFKRLKPFIKSQGRLRILEIGPGDGLLTSLLKEEHDVYVVDITSEYISCLTGISGAFIADIETMPFEDEFDVIILCDVLEHVLNEGDALMSIRNAMHVGGLMYIRCPSNEPLITYSRHLGSRYPYVHLRTYSSKTLKNVAIHTGFSVKKCSYVRTNPAGFARRNFGINRLKTDRSLRHTLDVYQAHHGLESTKPLSILDLLITKIEAVTWHIGWLFSKRVTNQVLQRVWYRPSEVFLVARKRPVVIPQSPIRKPE